MNGNIERERGYISPEMESGTTSSKKLNDDVVVFMRKRSETETPQYTARLKTYVDIHRKRHRAAIAHRHGEERKIASGHNVRGKDKPAEDINIQNAKLADDEISQRSLSRSQDEEPLDSCGRKKKRRRSRRRRRRRRSSSCKRKRKKPRCGRKRSRKRKRSRSCKRKRRSRRKKSCRRPKRRRC